MKKIIAVLVLIIGILSFLLFMQRGNTKEVKEVNDTNQPVASSSSDTEKKGTASGSILDLASQGLSEFPKSKLNDRKITKLDVSGNNLTGALPAEIRQLTNLEELDASSNKLTGIPAEIGQLSKLRIANFANNNISGLPLEIGNLKNLQTLDLRGNPNVSAYDIGQIQPKIPDAQILVD